MFFLQIGNISPSSFSPTGGNSSSPTMMTSQSTNQPCNNDDNVSKYIKNIKLIEIDKLSRPDPSDVNDLFGLSNRALGGQSSSSRKPPPQPKGDVFIDLETGDVIEDDVVSVSNSVDEIIEIQSTGDDDQGENDDVIMVDDVIKGVEDTVTNKIPDSRVVSIDVVDAPGETKPPEVIELE